MKLKMEREAADFLGLAVQTLRNWRASGNGSPYIKMGRAVRYSEADLRAFVEQRRITPWSKSEQSGA
ncbi:MAG: helix-turn-helix domain-containing protein [Deltaproteobacteria bacterium]|nr:helix-turn-helix domain-containing protein [Deltaproteobacteria bacterium]